MCRNLSDDVANLPELGPEYQWVVTTDSTHPGIHYPEHGDATLATRRALRRNISDMAASGAAPLAWLCALALPSGKPDKWYDEWLAMFSRCVMDDYRHYPIALIGGDICLVPYQIAGPVITITMIGTTHSNAPLRRSLAKHGDICCVSGPLGDAALAWQLYDPTSKNRDIFESTIQEACWPKYSNPEPPLILSSRLADLPRCAAIDISDGLLIDAERIAMASNLAIEIDFTKIPCSSAMNRWLTKHQDASCVLAGGDDYELFFTIPPKSLDSLVADADLPIFPIGHCLPKRSGVPAGTVSIINHSPHTLPLHTGFMHYPAKRPQSQ